MRTRGAETCQAPAAPPALADLACGALLERAFRWLCRRRRDFPAGAGVWTLRSRWPEEKRRLEAQLRSGRYRTRPLRLIQARDGQKLSLWSARDALVFKALAWRLEAVLPVSPRCFHVRGRGGAKATVAESGGTTVRRHHGEELAVRRRRSKCHPCRPWYARL